MTENKKRDRLMVYLKGLGPTLEKYCKEKAIGRSQYVLQLIAEALQKNPDVIVPKARRRLSEEAGRRAIERRRLAEEAKAQGDAGRIEFRATFKKDSYARMVAAKNASSTQSLPEFIEALVCQGTAVEVPTRTIAPDVIGVMARSNYELRALGRNINQIAHSLNLYPGKITDKERATLREVPMKMERHVLFVSQTLLSLNPPRPARRKPRAKTKETEHG